jgi:translation initiation factor IF-2
MVKEKQLRLGQIARKLNVGRNTIIDFLNKKGIEIDSNPNTKIDNDIYIMLENAFEDSAVEKKVASNIKIGLEEKSNDPKGFTKKIKNEKEEIKDEKNKKSKNANEIKIIKKIDLDDSGRKRVASSDQSKKKRRPRKRIVSNKKPSPSNLKQPDVKEDIDKKNKEIQDKIKSTLAKLSGSKETDTKRSKYRKEKRPQHAEAVEEEKIKQEEESKVLKVTEYISANDLAKLMDVSANDVISKYLEIGMFVSINQRLDAETISIIAEEFGYKVEFTTAEDEEINISEIPDEENDLKDRAPIVTIMGHVDHGKTSLLDYIRSSRVTADEAGGITQHIGAYDVETKSGQRIAFLDTPGHEAFTAMRARGAKITDIVIIVIAADSTVMPQTKEAINHSKVAEVPIVFAINKIDTPNANANKVKEDLSKIDVLVEDWGGKYQCQEVSAKTGQGIEDLLDKVLLEAELLELKANPNKNAIGTVIESELDKGRGYLTTMMVQGGTLNKGDIVLAGSQHGKVKALFDHRGKEKDKVGPATPILMLGLSGAPQAGDKFNVFETDKEAREIATKREQLIREQKLRTKKHVTLDEIGRRLALGNFKELSIVLKGDVDGSIEALSDSMEKLSSDEISVNIIHRGVGQITESDVLLASASDAIIVGFQVRPSINARKLAEKEGIDIRLYSIIYEAINEIKSAMEGMLEPTEEENIVGNVEVRETYKISKVGTIAGCYVTNGDIIRKNKIRLIRDGIVIFTGKIKQLKRFKDDVNEVKNGYECGLSIEDFNDIKIGDNIESFEIKEIKRKL